MGIILNVLFSGMRPAIPAGASLTSKVTRVIIHLMKNFSSISQCSFLVLYGSKEILLDRVRDIRKVKKNIVITHATNINNFLNKIFIKKDKLIGPLNFNVVHGSLYMGSGVLGSTAAMHKLGWINIGGLGLPLEVASNCLFNFACLAALIHNIKIYRAAAKVPKYAPLHEKEAAWMLKKSAILGIISSLNYILAASLLIAGASATFALLFGCIAVFTGCLKILYDFLRFRNAR